MNDLLGTALAAGRYEVQSLLGSGAMGHVYLAFDRRLQRRVVVKVLDEALASDARVRARFANEALIQANIVHPHIVRALDALEETGFLAIVMDYVDGGDLHGHLQAHGGKLGLAQVLAIMDPVLDAVAAAHASGVVHRDLKPANILLESGPQGPVPKVTDFGIAKILDPGSSAGMTRVGAVMGTPAYMAPEQMRGAADADARADVFALGAILYELATGVRVLERGTEFDVPPPSAHAPELPPSFDAAVLRAMKPSRDARFQTVEELKAALIDAHRAAGEGPLTRAEVPPSDSGAPPTVFEAPGPTTAHVAGPPPAAPRRRGLWVPIALSTLALCAGGVAVWQIAAAPPQAADAAPAAPRAEAEPASSSGVVPLSSSTASAPAPAPAPAPVRQPAEEPEPAPVVTAPDVLVSETTGYRLRRIEPGTFMMGSRDNPASCPKSGGDWRDCESPHSVTLTRPFYVGETEVTQAAWRRVMGSNPSRHLGDDRPVESVTWFDAVSMANRLSELEGLTPAYRIEGAGGRRVEWPDRHADGYRLLTEAEWEYAARGGQDHRYAGAVSPSAVAWYEGTSGRRGTSPVGQRMANGYGLHDMSGNVWEWVWDWNGVYPDGAVTDPQGPMTGDERCYRGGSWKEAADIARVANRGYYYPHKKKDIRGLRLARSAPR